MKGMKIAGALALALICGTFMPNIAEVHAVENVVVTETQLDRAIEIAQQALDATANIASVSGQAEYLRGLVAQAKELARDFEANKHKNLGELVAALNEGAEGIILISGINQVAEEKESVVAENVPASSASVNEAAPVVWAANATVAANPVVVKKSVEPAEAKTENNQRAEVATNVGVAVTVEKDEPIDAPENPLGEDEQVEVPKTGEAEKDGPSPVAVGITAGVIVFVAACGAIAIVKRLKRDA